MGRLPPSSGRAGCSLAGGHGEVEGYQGVSSSLGAIQAYRHVGELAAARGDVREALEHLEHSLSLAERCCFPFEAALTRLVRGRTLGTAPDAAADIEAACAYFEEVGADPALTTAIGLWKEPSAIRVPVQERLSLEIAIGLFISPRAVDRHLRNIFNKTGVSNRAALAAYALRHGLLR